MNKAFHLYQLQKVDSQLLSIEKRIAEIESIIAKDERILRVERAIQIANADLDKTRKKLHELEAQAKNIQIEIETNDSSLYSGKIHNPKELNDLQQKIASDRKRLERNEEEQLDVLAEIDEKDQVLKQRENQSIEIRSIVATAHSQLNGEKSQLIHQKETLQTEKEAKLTSVDEESLSTYKKLMMQKNGTAVALVEDRSCSLCGAPLTPGEWQAARSSSNLTFCSTCGRILYAS